MGTSVVIYNILSFLNPTIQLQAVCIFLAPFFASNTTIVTYFFAKEVVFNQNTSLFIDLHTLVERISANR